MEVLPIFAITVVALTIGVIAILKTLNFKD